MTKPSEDIFSVLKSGITQGVKKGGKGFLWIIKIILPISFATSLLVHFGLISKLDFILAPLMNWLSLPASAAIVLVAGILTGIYGAVAALSVLPFSMDHMILMAIFTLISHNMIQESMVQGKSGINPWFAALFRFFMSFLVTWICAKIMGVKPESLVQAGSEVMSGSGVSFWAMVKNWVTASLKLSLLIACIIISIMIILETAKTLDIISKISRVIKPLVSVMGLKQSTGILWLTAVVFGLSYGSAVIVEETRENEYEKQDLTKLHLSIGINHAMIEDPSLFLPLGLPVFWLWIPRLVAAIVAVWFYKLFLCARRIYAE